MCNSDGLPKQKNPWETVSKKNDSKFNSERTTGFGDSVTANYQRDNYQRQTPRRPMGNVSLIMSYPSSKVHCFIGFFYLIIFNNT